MHPLWCFSIVFVVHNLFLYSFISAFTFHEVVPPVISSAKTSILQDHKHKTRELEMSLASWLDDVNKRHANTVYASKEIDKVSSFGFIRRLLTAL